LDNNVNDRLKSMLGSGNVKDSLEPVMKILSSPEGQRFMKSLTPAEKKAIVDRFMSLDKNAVRNCLNGFNPAMLSGMSVQDILDKLR